MRLGNIAQIIVLTLAITSTYYAISEVMTHYNDYQELRVKKLFHYLNLLQF